jgi:hypothetical protein
MFDASVIAFAGILGEEPQASRKQLGGDGTTQTPPS